MNETQTNNIDTILSELYKERICIYCNENFKYATSIGKWECWKHAGPGPYKINSRSDEKKYLCCGKDEFSTGCQECDHSHLPITDSVISIPLFFLRKNHIEKPDSSKIKEIQEFKIIVDEKEELDLFKTLFKFYRIKNKKK